MNKTAAQPGETIENQMADRRIGGVRDSVDERLISLLRRNARMTLTALARELSLSRTAVQARMARLERDRVILGYQALVVADLQPATLLSRRREVPPLARDHELLLGDRPERRLRGGQGE